MAAITPPASAPPARVLTDDLDATYLSADHVIHAAKAGTFIPLATEVEVEVDWSGTLEGVAHVGGFFAWNQDTTPGTDLMTGVGFAGTSHITGTSIETIGPAGGPGSVGGASRRFRISGVQPGVETTYEVELGSVGYYESYELGAGSYPIDLALSLDGETLYVTQYTGNRVNRFDSGVRWSVDGMLEDRGSLNGHPGAYGIAVHPTDPDRIAVARSDADTVVEVNPHTNAIYGSYAVTDPHYLAYNADGTKLFVVQNGRDEVTPITIGGAVGAAIAVGDSPWKPIVIGGYLYVACSGANRIDKIDTASHALTSLAMGAATTPVAVAADPDGDRLWVLEKASGTKRARAVDLATFAFTADDPVTGFTSQSANDLAVSPSGRSMVVAGSGTGHDMSTFVLPSKGVAYESATGGDLARLIISAEGDILAINNADTGVIHHWHAARVEIDPTSEFWGGHLNVTIQPAEAP
jgi:DNA-binding beta-propeller fold protein YncE